MGAAQLWDKSSTAFSQRSGTAYRSARKRQRFRYEGNANGGSSLQK